MRRILCTGDSHTWGQGADGVLEAFDPPVQAGELRLTDFKCGSYVNLLRRRVEVATGSFSEEWGAQRLAALPGGEFCSPWARVGARMELDFSGALLRIEYARGRRPCAFEAAVDGERLAERAEPAASGGDECRILTLHLPEGRHQMSLKVTAGELLLYRIESYGGAYAVVNGGIGSCPSFRYGERYFQDYVEAVRPDIVLAEAHTINDWLAGDPPGTYGTRLGALLERFRGLGAEVILLTVAPIAGPQVRESGSPYGDYVEASRTAARKMGVPVCDANRVMELGLAGMREEEARAWLYCDDWHPNGRGHAIYAELLFQALIDLL